MNKKKIRMLYVISAPYSGSTLFSFLLSSHKDVASVGELSGLDPKINKDKYKCSCGLLIKKCNFWYMIHEGMMKKGVPFSILDQKKQWRCSTNRYIHHLLTRATKLPFLDKAQGFILKHFSPFNTRIASFLDKSVAVMHEILSYYSATIFLDTSKNIDRLQILRRSEYIDVRVLHLVRDGRGQTSSKIQRDVDMASAARSLVRFDNQATNIKQLVGDERFLRVKYEDICRTPESQLKQIAAFAGIDPDGFPKDFIAKESHTLGNPMLYDFNGQIELDERWKQHLSEEELVVFYRVAGGRNRFFSYDN